MLVRVFKEHVNICMYVCLKKDYKMIHFQFQLILLSVTYLKSAALIFNSNETIKNSYFKRDIFGPKTYAFGYEINDKESGNLQFRDERRFMNSTVVGSYGNLQPDGRITVTHYVADNSTGYHSTMDTYEPGPNTKFLNMPLRVRNFPQNITEDKERYLNISNTEVPKNITDSLMKQFDINTNVDVLTDAAVDPLIKSILNGDTKNTSIELTTVRNLLPTSFPIVPFLLPQDNLTTEVPKTSVSATKMSDMPAPIPLVTNETDKIEGTLPWYEKIIQQNRKEFLENLPNLN